MKKICEKKVDNNWQECFTSMVELKNIKESEVKMMFRTTNYNVKHNMNQTITSVSLQY